MLVMPKSLTDLMIMFHLLVILALFRRGFCVGNAKFPHDCYQHIFGLGCTKFLIGKMGAGF